MEFWLCYNGHAGISLRPADTENEAAAHSIRRRTKFVSSRKRRMNLFPLCALTVQLCRGMQDDPVARGARDRQKGALGERGKILRLRIQSYTTGIDGQRHELTFGSLVMNALRLAERTL